MLKEIEGCQRKAKLWGYAEDAARYGPTSAVISPLLIAMSSASFGNDIPPNIREAMIQCICPYMAFFMASILAGSHFSGKVAERKMDVIEQLGDLEEEYKRVSDNGKFPVVNSTCTRVE